MALKPTAPTDAAMSALQTENITRRNAANNKPRDNTAGMDSAICNKEASRPQSCLSALKNIRISRFYFYFDEMFMSACCHSQWERRQKEGDKNAHATSTSIS